MQILRKLLPRTQHLRPFSTIEPVRLAYASYESTAPVSPEDPSPLIILHGLFGSKSNWNSLCKVYHNKTKRKVFALDARNHGDSPHSPYHTYDHLAEDLKDTLDRLQFKKVSLLGHSMGGRAVMLFALKYPEFVDKLLVGDISPVSTSPSLGTTPELFEVLQKVKLPKNVNMSNARTQTDLELSKFIQDKGLRAFLLTNLVQKMDGSYTWRVNLAALSANFEEIARFPPINTLNFIGPVLFIAGGNSDYLRKEDQSEILKIFPKAGFKSIEGAGHWVHSEKPAEFLEITIEFLNNLL